MRTADKIFYEFDKLTLRATSMSVADIHNAFWISWDEYDRIRKLFGVKKYDGDKALKSIKYFDNWGKNKFILGKNYEKRVR